MNYDLEGKRQFMLEFIMNSLHFYFKNNNTFGLKGYIFYLFGWNNNTQILLYNMEYIRLVGRACLHSHYLLAHKFKYKFDKLYTSLF